MICIIKFGACKKMLLDPWCLAQAELNMDYIEHDTSINGSGFIHSYAKHLCAMWGLKIALRLLPLHLYSLNLMETIYLIFANRHRRTQKHRHTHTHKWT